MSDTAQAGKNGSDLRVIVVEDHAGLRTVLTRVLKFAQGIECCGSFEGGRDALVGIPEIMPDIVTLDLSMPDMDGIEVLEVIREKWPEIQCILLSGHDESSYAKQALDSGARGYVVKGDAPELLEAIRAVADGRRFVSAPFASLLEESRIMNDE